MDNFEYPNIALVESASVGGFAFLGDIRTEEQGELLGYFLKEELFPLLQSRGINGFEFSADHKHVAKQILSMFQDKEIGQEQEFSHRNDKTISSSEISLPQGYTLHQVDDKLWESLHGNELANGHFLANKIKVSWNSFDDFMNKSIAFCITYENHIVAVIVGTARFNDTLAIDIETIQEHQGKGLAFILTMSFVNECVTRGLNAQWDCVESNVKSKKLAEKAGFKLITQQPVYWFEI